MKFFYWYLFAWLKSLLGIYPFISVILLVVEQSNYNTPFYIQPATNSSGGAKITCSDTSCLSGSSCASNSTCLDTCSLPSCTYPNFCCWVVVNQVCVVNSSEPCGGSYPGGACCESGGNHMCGNFLHLPSYSDDYCNLVVDSYGVYYAYLAVMGFIVVAGLLGTVTWSCVSEDIKYFAIFAFRNPLLAPFALIFLPKKFAELKDEFKESLLLQDIFYAIFTDALSLAGSIVLFFAQSLIGPIAPLHEAALIGSCLSLGLCFATFFYRVKKMFDKMGV